MDEARLVRHIESLGGVVIVVSSPENGGPAGTWADTFFFYDPRAVGAETRRFPFATIVTQDYPGFDDASRLDREGVFRLNLWVGKDACRRLFADRAADDHDASLLDQLIPHPVYFPQGWVSVLNPGPRSWDLARELIAAAHRGAVRRYENRMSGPQTGAVSQAE